MTEKYDAAVIGGGPGGYTAAIRLSQLGKKTAMIEKRDLGGTCLNRGCIPTKSLLQSAEVFKTVKEAGKFGVTAKEISFDYKKIADKKDQTISMLRKGIAGLEKNAGVDVYFGTASFRDKNTLLIDEKEICSDNIIIATGSYPAKIPLPGINSEGVIDSDRALSLSECPKSIVIIGGGVIGIEFATLFNALGTKVVIVEALPDILSNFDAEINGLIRKKLLKEGIEIFTNAKVTRIEPGPVVYFEQNGEKSVKGELCLVAIGRKPLTDELKLNNIGLETERGYIKTDEYMRTGIPGIYAIGDVTGRIQLAHAASAEGIVAAHNIAGEYIKMDYKIVPSCVYTHPEIASVGLTEIQAKEKGLNFKTGRFYVAGNSRSKIMDEKEGVVKILTEQSTGEILGCHIIAPRATDIIGEICAVMRSEGTVDELRNTIHPHPSVSEMIFEAACDAAGMSVNKS